MLCETNVEFKLVGVGESYIAFKYLMTLMRKTPLEIGCNTMSRKLILRRRRFEQQKDLQLCQNLKENPKLAALGRVSIHRLLSGYLSKLPSRYVATRSDTVSKKRA